MKIAIQGHLTRGKEVIQILESLGGKTIFVGLGFDERYYYYINPNSIIIESSLITIKTKDEFKLYTLEEFEKEFPFKLGDKVTDHEGDVAIITGFAYIEENLGYSLQYENGRGTATPRILKPFKEMKEERNITLTLDKAKEWYNKGGELREIALQAFNEQELNPLPRSWDEFCDKYPVKKEECIIGPDNISVTPWGISVRRLKTWIPSKKSAEAHLAMIQLEQLRNCWWNSWEPEYNCGTKYTIKWDKDDLIVATSGRIRAFLIFPTREMAEEFLKCFRDLIEKAGDLI